MAEQKKPVRQYKLALTWINTMNKFFAIEGLDGSGKSTQISLLKNYFENKGIAYTYIHFPRMELGLYGRMISSFLRGEYGEIKDVNPYLVSLIFAGDRDEAKQQILQSLNNNEIVMVDRYVYSNIAFQCAKLKDPSSKTRLKNWIIELEYNHNGIPGPFISFYLNTSMSFIEQQLSAERLGSERNYLHGQKDIHESCIDFQKEVANEYSILAEGEKDFSVINCFDEDKDILTPLEIHEKVINALKSNGII